MTAKPDPAPCRATNALKRLEALGHEDDTRRRLRRQARTAARAVCAEEGLTTLPATLPEPVLRWGGAPDGLAHLASAAGTAACGAWLTLAKPLEHPPEPLCPACRARVGGATCSTEL